MSTDIDIPAIRERAAKARALPAGNFAAPFHSHYNALQIALADVEVLAKEVERLRGENAKLKASYRRKGWKFDIHMVGTKSTQVIWADTEELAREEAVSIHAKSVLGRELIPGERYEVLVSEV